MKKNNQVNSLGITLDDEVFYSDPYGGVTSHGFAMDIIMELLLIFFGILGVLFCLNDGFAFSCDLTRVFYVLLGCCLYFYFMKSFDTEIRLIVKIVGAAAFITVVLIYKETVAESILSLYDAIAQNYNSYYGINLPVFDTEGTADAALIIFMLPVCGLLSFAAEKKRTFFYLIAAFLPYPLLTMVCGHMPDLDSLLMVIICFMGLLICKKTAVDDVMVDAENSLRVGVYGTVTFIVVLIFLLSAYFGYGLFYPKVEGKVAPVRYALYNSSIQELYAQFRHKTSVGGLNGGSINGRTSINYDNTVHLVVKADADVENYTYLKGYVGVNYEGTSWSGLSEDVYDTEKYQALLEYDEDDILSLTYNLVGYAKSAYSSDIFSDFTAVRWYVTVPDEEVNDSGFLCFPYAGLASSTDGDINDLSWLSRRYEEGLDNLYDSYSFTISDVLSSVAGDVREIEEYCQYAYAMDTYTERLVETVEMEKAYREFVYENYLEVPDSVSRLNEEYSAYEGYFDTISGAVKFVQNEVADGATYTLSPSVLPYGEDFIEYFMYESKEGYCVYFASAAVMIFRSMGIPARYVEGYLIPPVEADTEVSIEDTNAHAWAEIYVDGFGWVPVEVTPGYYGEAGGFTPEINEEISSGGSSDGNESEAEDETETESEDETRDETDNGTESETEDETGGAESTSVSNETDEETGDSASETENVTGENDETGEADATGTGESDDSHGGDDETDENGNAVSGGDESKTSEAAEGVTEIADDSDASGEDSETEHKAGFEISEEVIRGIKTALCIVFAVLIVILALLVHRRGVVHKRKKSFNQKNVANSTLSIYGEIIRMSRRYYIPVSEDSSIEELLKGYPLEEEEWQQFFELVHEAAFSDHEMGEEAKSLALSVYYKCCRCVYEQIGFIKKAVFTVWDGYR